MCAGAPEARSIRAPEAGVTVSCEPQEMGGES